MIERGDLREQSFGFYVTEQHWEDIDENYSRRTIITMDLIENSVVPRGANGAAANIRSEMDYERALAVLAEKREAMLAEEAGKIRKEIRSGSFMPYLF